MLLVATIEFTSIQYQKRMSSVSPMVEFQAHTWLSISQFFIFAHNNICLTLCLNDYHVSREKKLAQFFGQKWMTLIMNGLWDGSVKKPFATVMTRKWKKTSVNWIKIMKQPKFWQQVYQMAPRNPTHTLNPPPPLDPLPCPHPCHPIESTPTLDPKPTTHQTPPCQTHHL